MTSAKLVKSGKTYYNKKFTVEIDINSSSDSQIAIALSILNKMKSELQVKTYCYYWFENLIKIIENN